MTFFTLTTYSRELFPLPTGFRTRVAFAGQGATRVTFSFPPVAFLQMVTAVSRGDSTGRILPTSSGKLIWMSLMTAGQ